MTQKHQNRYAIRCEIDDTWTVYDIFTGVPCAAGPSVAIGMEEEFAQYLRDLMNSDYIANRHARKASRN